MSKPKREVVHWSAGHLEPSKPYYHFLIDRQGKVHPGKYPVEANCRDSFADGKYAPHVKDANGYTIGIAMIGMWDAKGPKDLGSQPLLAVQWHACVDLTAELFHKYGLSVNHSTLAGHCEVAKLWGRDQRGKYDPWLPFPEWPWARGLNPEQIGDYFRDSVAKRLKELQAVVK